ncbi:MAG: ribbon-helix-helix domain-containing protein [Candidatus Njordarchaeia archaeon]
MQTISFKTTDEMLRKMDEMVERGLFVSRSDLIRSAIRLLLEQYERILRERSEKIRI